MVESGCDSRVVRASDSQCCVRTVDPSILRHSGIWGAADEAVLNIVHKNKNPKKEDVWEYKLQLLNQPPLQTGSTESTWTVQWQSCKEYMERWPESLSCPLGPLASWDSDNGSPFLSVLCVAGTGSSILAVTGGARRWCEPNHTTAYSRLIQKNFFTSTAKGP